MTSLRALRDCELPPELAFKLAPFISSWRPHDPPPSRTYLESLGYEKIEEYTFTDELEDYYVGLHGCTPEERMQRESVTEEVR